MRVGKPIRLQLLCELESPLWSHACGQDKLATLLARSRGQNRSWVQAVGECVALTWTRLGGQLTRPGRRR